MLSMSLLESVAWHAYIRILVKIHVVPFAPCFKFPLSVCLELVGHLIKLRPFHLSRTIVENKGIKVREQLLLQIWRRGIMNLHQLFIY